LKQTQGDENAAQSIANGGRMKAVVVHGYGSPDVLRYEEFANPTAGDGEILIRVAATSINPIDVMRRSGKWKETFPIKFPDIIGVDVAGTVEQLGSGVEGFSVGEQVFAFADHAYAELCTVSASIIAKIPSGLGMMEAAALPLVSTTGNLLVSRGTGITAGQTVVITGAVGNVGRSAVATAKQRGAKVIAAVRNNQLEEAASLGVEAVVATNDMDGILKLPAVDAVADTVGGATAEALLPKVRAGGVFASVVAVPEKAKDFPTVKSLWVGSRPDASILLQMARAVVDGDLLLPIARRLPLKDAATGHAEFESGVRGKILLVA
jgi:NADPH:quinone reductase-like Zn-dependent oxidoreductase